MNIAFALSFMGTDYHGWQRQKNADTIQQTIERALHDLCGGNPYLSGCGRTDAGVHAKKYVANAKLNTTIPLKRLPGALNARLPSCIVIHKATETEDDFDSRFSCIDKEYTYIIHNAGTRDPFLQDRAHFYPHALDVTAMSRAAEHFVGKLDFAAVKSEGTPVKSTVRTIKYCKVHSNGDQIYITVCADGFLYNMVRAISGTLLYCGNGKIDPDSIPDILASRQRARAGATLPPGGLYMTNQRYDRDFFQR